MPDRVTQFLLLFENAKWEELRRMAHQLKGAAGSYGFEPITEAAARLENAIRQTQPEERIQAAVEEVVQLCRSAQVGSGV